jgi:hypothetical protein
MEENQGEELKCRVPLKMFKDACPESWVQHFLRKHNYEKYKQAIEERGFLSADEDQFRREQQEQSKAS